MTGRPFHLVLPFGEIYTMIYPMVIEQTVEIPADRCLHLSLELPFTVPAGIKTRIAISIPAPESFAPDMGIKTFRGILKGKGISLERFRAMQREDKAIEDAVDERWNDDTVNRR
jgi:hypothetical protein